jgi:hypothetical protein
MIAQQDELKNLKMGDNEKEERKKETPYGSLISNNYSNLKNINIDNSSYAYNLGKSR